MEDDLEGNKSSETTGSQEPEIEAPIESEDEQSDLVQTLRDDLSAAEGRAAEYLDGWQRAQAEFSNYKKRQEADRSQMMLLANANLLGKLLPVVDDFERAMATQPSGLDRLSWVEGFHMIKLKLDGILHNEGVKPIVTEGQLFDPVYHEAITYEVVEGFEEGQVIGDVQRGYMLADRVLRPALVRVGKAPPAPPVADPGSDDGEEQADG